MYIASEFILLGSHHRWGLLAAGAGLALLAFGISLWLSLGPGYDNPRPKWFAWAIGGVALSYIVVAAVAGAALGPVWAAGALGAGVIPMTAVSLLLAATRAKTAMTDAGLRDVSGGPEDTTPGMGLDEQSPLGDTSEHSPAILDPGSGESPQGDNRRSRRLPVR
jgi:hypothetical protein